MDLPLSFHATVVAIDKGGKQVIDTAQEHTTYTVCNPTFLRPACYTSHMLSKDVRFTSQSFPTHRTWTHLAHGTVVTLQLSRISSDKTILDESKVVWTQSITLPPAENIKWGKGKVPIYRLNQFLQLKRCESGLYNLKCISVNLADIPFVKTWSSTALEYLSCLDVMDLTQKRKREQEGVVQKEQEKLRKIEQELAEQKSKGKLLCTQLE